MSEQTWQGEGYDAEVSTGGGVFFSLRTKGQKARLRLASLPYRWEHEFEEQGTGKKVMRKQIAWVAILKEVVDGQAVKRVVVYRAGPMVYSIIRALASDPDWGDPTHYDISVERTEEAGRYYVVTPLPKPTPGPLSKDDLKLVADAGIDWPAVCTAKGDTATTKGDLSDPNFDPFADE